MSNNMQRRPAEPMLAPDRRRLLLQQLRRNGSARVDDLAHALGVSAATVRRDLDVLADEGLLLRARGGAYLPHRVEAQSAPRADPAHDTAKQRIGNVAAERVRDGMTVMILAGSTTGAMLPHLARRSITVVTNGLDIAHALAPSPTIELVMLGGVLNRDFMTFLGPMAEQNMANLHVDIMFAGAYGIDARVGVTGAKVSQAGNHHVMLRHTESLVVLAEAGKFGRQGPTLLARIEQIDSFVTDSSADQQVLADLRDLGATIDVC